MVDDLRKTLLLGDRNSKGFHNVTFSNEESIMELSANSRGAYYIIRLVI